MERSSPLVVRDVEGSLRRIWERRELKAVKVVSFLLLLLLRRVALR